MNVASSLPLRAVLALLTSAALVASGCASTGSSSVASADVPSAPAVAAKKPMEPPSWDALVYENEEHGFSVHYPADFSEAPAQDGGLFSAASPMQVPRIDVLLLPAGSSIEELSPLLEQNMAQVGGGEAKVTASGGVTLEDEVTQGMEFTLDWTFQGFPLTSVVLGAPAEGGTVGVMVTGMQGGELQELRDIAYTLYVD